MPKPSCFEPKRERENMVADRAYSLGLLASPDRRTSLLYFAAAVPTVGFVHGATDLNLINAAALEGYAETRFIKRAQRSDMAAQTSKRWPLGLRWLA
jgi:hypothetical protein